MIGTQASAALTTYNLSGAFDDGAILSGSFVFDDAATSFAQYSDVNIDVSGLPALVSLNSMSYSGDTVANSTFQITVSDVSYQSTVLFAFQALHDGFKVNAITSDVLIPDYSLYATAAETHFLVSGTIRPSTGPAVPEPASWAMTIAGIGFAGGALRRRRSVTTAEACGRPEQAKVRTG